MRGMRKIHSTFYMTFLLISVFSSREFGDEEGSSKGRSATPSKGDGSKAGGGGGKGGNVSAAAKLRASSFSSSQEQTYSFYF